MPHSNAKRVRAQLNRRYGQCILQVTFFLHCSIVLAADWPQWLGPTRNGVSTEALEPWNKPPTVVWKQSIGSGFSVPIVAGGILFVHSEAAGEDAEKVTAFDSKTGKELWGDQYPRAKYRSELGSGPRATPVVDRGQLFTIGITGELICYEAVSGKRLWQINPYTELKVPVPGFGVCSSPCIAGDVVVLSVGGAGNGVVAYKRTDGLQAWAALDEPAAAASPILRRMGNEADNATEIIVQTTLRLAGLNPLNGAINWEHPLVFQPSGVSPTPLLVGSSLICSTQDTGTLSLGLRTTNKEAVEAAEKVVTDLKRPELKWWKQQASSYFSTGTVVNEDHVCVVTNSLLPIPRADVRCFAIATGEEIWLKSGLGYFHVGLIMTSNGKLLTLDDTGNLSLAEIDDQYKQLCTAKVCGGTFCNPVLSDGLIFVRDRTGLTCLDTKN